MNLATVSGLVRSVPVAIDIPDLAISTAIDRLVSLIKRGAIVPSSFLPSTARGVLFCDGLNAGYVPFATKRCKPRTRLLFVQPENPRL